MTDEQHIENLKKLKSFHNGSYGADIDRAIKALEQEPSEDVAKECYEDLCRYFGNAKDILKNREDFKAWLDRIKWHIHKAEELSTENDDLRDQLAMRDRFQKQDPCEDWYDVPSDEMTLEQARQAVKDLRKMWAEYRAKPCEDDDGAFDVIGK